MPTKDKEKKAKYAKEYYKKNKQRVRAYNKKWWQEHPHRVRELHLQRYFGMSELDYLDILGMQNECCAICGRHKDKFQKSLSVDHKHIEGEVRGKPETIGKIRGLLCSNCNAGLGWYEKCQEKIVSYLKNN